ARAERGLGLRPTPSRDREARAGGAVRARARAGHGGDPGRARAAAALAAWPRRQYPGGTPVGQQRCLVRSLVRRVVDAALGRAGLEVRRISVAPPGADVLYPTYLRTLAEMDGW